MTNPLSEKAVLASVNIRRWTGRRLDREITEEVNTSHNAEQDAGRYNKLLIAKKHFADIHRLTRLGRNLQRTMTLPWIHDGAGILPTANYDKFAAQLRDVRNDFDAAADEFAKNYPRYVKEAEKRLNGMFKAEDYPDPSRVRSMFSFDVYVMPCPDVQDFRVSLAKEQLQDTESRIRDALQEAMQEPVRRIVEVVGHMAERLEAYRPSTGQGDRAENTFRDSLVGNVKELVDLLPAFNLTDDKKLAKLTERMARELCSVEAQDLRDDEVARKRVAEAAQDILDKANAMMA